MHRDASRLYNCGKGIIRWESRTNGNNLSRRRSADLNDHVEDQRDDFEREHGGNGYVQMNNEEEDLLRFTQVTNIAQSSIIQAIPLITYKSRQRSSAIDYHANKETKPEVGEIFRGDTWRE